MLVKVAGEGKDMQQEPVRVQVDIFGDQYTVKGQDSEAHVRELAQYVDKQMRNLAVRNPRLSPVKLAVLAAMNIADELKKMQEDYTSLVQLLEEDQA